jgi:sarcosine oxidase
MSNVVVIGAGVFGAWSAWFLAQAGHHVTLMDAYGPANGRASSADHSRVIRAGYGRDAIYSQWASASLGDWTWLSEATGHPLLTKTGALFLGEPGNLYVRDTYETLTALGLGAEWLEPRDIAERFPQISITGLGSVLYEHDAGVLRARASVQSLIRLGVSQSVDFRMARLATVDESKAAADLRMTDGSAIDADVYVIACGPWLPQLFPQAIGGRIRATRQEVLFFGVPAGDRRFSVPQLPVWIDFAAGVYGIPDLDAHGFKVGIDRHGPPIDPDTADRLVGHEIVASTRDWIAHRFPALSGAPLLDARVCQYENTSSGDLIIDQHPAWRNVWIVGGGSGHGFKHGPAVGRYVAELIAGTGLPEPRFALDSKSVESKRVVY